MKYQVKIYLANPRNNSTVECETLDEAKSEMGKYASDDSGDCVKLFENGECIAFREMNKKNITWMKPISAAAAALGRIKTPKKAKSSRENGKKGGRPRKTNRE